jgi:hypothetical protein
MADTVGPQLVWSRERSFIAEPFEDIKPRYSGYLIKGVLPLAGVGFIAGASKGGKTFIALDWGLKIAAGAATVMGRKAKQTGVAYIGAEDPDGCRSRVLAWKRRNPRGSYTPFSLIGRGVNLLDEDEVSQLITELTDLAAVYEEQGHALGLVVFDTLAKCMAGGEENGSVDGGRALAALERVQREISCLVVALAHHGKSGEDKGIRGWSGFDAASDATITVERDKDDPDFRKLTLSKVKNGPDGAVVGFRLERVNLGIQDEDGDELWSCVVAYDAAAPDKILPRRRKALSAQAEIVMVQFGRLVDGGAAQVVPKSLEGVRQDRDTLGVRRPDLSLECAVNGLRYAEDEKANTYNTRFGRALNELQGAKRLRVEGDLIWAI